MSVDAEWSSRVHAWAEREPDIAALFQFGSRIQATGVADSWSDYDYQLVTSRPKKFLDGVVFSGLGTFEVCTSQRAKGAGSKVTLIFPGALEADFVIVPKWGVLVVTTALRWPNLARHWPPVIAEGIKQLGLAVGPGWKVIKGGDKWIRRYERIRPTADVLTPRTFEHLCSHFWAQAVWTVKKLRRGELVATRRALHRELSDVALRLMREEAMINEKLTGTDGRRAERWLPAVRLEQLAFLSQLDTQVLAKAIQSQVEAFRDLAPYVAGKRGFSYAEPFGTSQWISQELAVAAAASARRA